MSAFAPARLASLDAFRGFTIAAMILVNNPGSWSHLYPQLDHAKWHGWTFTDWIFPFFLFIAGVSMAISAGRRAGSGIGRAGLVAQFARRAVVLFAIGIALNLVPAFDFSTVRIPGVLQRIGLCILLAAPLVVFVDGRRLWLWIVALLAIYAWVMLFVPVPDAQGRVAVGVLQPGRDAGAFIDRTLMEGHLWAKSKTWDPEGLLSTLPALCSLLFGVLAGRWLTSGRSPAEKTAWMLLAGLACLWAGVILDSLLMPINKSLWTVSYCIFMTGWALLVFAAFFWLIDANGSETLCARARTAFLPFTIFGMNALFLFALSGLVAKMLAAIKVAGSAGTTVSLKALLYAPIEALPIGAVNASLLYAIAFDLAMFALAWWLWKRRWFIKV